MQRTTLASTLAFALVLSGSLAFAQQPASQPPPSPTPQAEQGAKMHGHHRGRPDAHRQTAMMSKRLNLSPDQTAKLEPILTARQQKMSALQADTSLTPDARREHFRAIHKETKQQLDAVLTPEQREQMKSMRHGRHMHGEGQPQGLAPTGL